MISYFLFEMSFSYSSADRGLVLKTRGILDPEIDNGYHTIEGKRRRDEHMEVPKNQGKGAEFL